MGKLKLSVFQKNELQYTESCAKLYARSKVQFGAMIQQQLHTHKRRLMQVSMSEIWNCTNVTTELVAIV